MANFNLEEIKLTPQQQNDLVALKAYPGFEVILYLMKSVCDNFVADLMNTSVIKPDDVLARHMTAQTAIRLYAQFVDRLNHEILEVKGVEREKTPIDITDGIIDLGETHQDYREEVEWV